MEKFNVNVSSEIGILNGVIIHAPGMEIENMTPQNAERALYSDILNLAIASQEYNQFKGVLEKVTRTFEIKDLLTEVLYNQKVKNQIVTDICTRENLISLQDFLMQQPPDELARLLIEGVEFKKNSLTKYLNPERFELKPLHNFFFARDSAIVINNTVLIPHMANLVREREALLSEAIFDFHRYLSTKSINPLKYPNFNSKITMEGGDILIAREDTLIIGLSSRTTSQGIDFIIKHFSCDNKIKHILVQELPEKPESFIHLDMVFTFLDKNYVMTYEPVIFKSGRFFTLNIEIDNCKIVKIEEEKNLIEALRKLKFDIEPIFCGGDKDEYIQEREQWHSGANFFAFAPGKVIGYERNVHTIDELNKKGFEVLRAREVIEGKKHPNDYERCVVTIYGAELARGGGGARCMTMPVGRQQIDW